ncbi:hypothetical protein IDAT_12905 [Pseudidiomarina atlantica]|uniref:Uncharacterized protein n=1 Tax=Pseudidiomarina atlantica TaxID=1517416 RepID=A0A094IKR2_9GAMM|nr:hypothetical protein [Pseudidiomarina atlantica]KFZ27767.1 hypothetical protein IDAT_12905 [Pseudidiomarina atlantica]
MTIVENLPTFVTCADSETSKSISENYDQAFTTALHYGVKFPLPKNMEILAINDGFIHSSETFKNLGRLIKEFASEGAYFFFPLASFNDVFKAHFCFEVMEWIETVVFESPVVFLISEPKLFIIVDEQLSITVIAYLVDIEENVLEKLGGKDILRDKFESSLRDNYVGSGDVEKKWLKSFSEKYCDW